jgi:hypothetical protein
MTRNDFLNPLYASGPFFVAFITWLAGWGSLLLFAWRTDILFEFFRNPKFMISDFLLLPTCGFLVTRFYHSIEEPTAPAASAKVAHTTLALATMATILATLYSVFISNNYGGVWAVPHTLFIWFIAYMLIGFFIRSVLQSRAHPTPRVWPHQIGVALSLIGHAIFGSLWG